jgi:hypothetical protein
MLRRAHEKLRDSLSWILVAIFCFLLSVLMTVRYVKYRARANHEAHWNKMFERGNTFAEANGRPGNNLLVSADASAVPLAIIQPGAAAEFRQIQLPWEDSQGSGGTLRHIDGCLPVGAGQDLLWQGGDLFLARSPNRLKRIWTTDEAGCEFGESGTVCFDGRYAWALANRDKGSPRLLVVAPETEQVSEFTAADGSLSPVHDLADTAKGFRLAMAPVSPGRICAIVKPWVNSSAVGADAGQSRPASANSFWLGTLDFEAPDRRTATRIPASAATQLFAWPVEMYALNDGSKRGVVVSRGGGYPHLVVAPDLRRIDVAKTAPSAGIQSSPAAVQYRAHDGAIWRMRDLQSVIPFPGTPALVRAGLPDVTEQVVLRQVPVGMLVSRKGSLYIIGERCWLLRGEGPEVEAIANEPPWQFDDFLNSNAVVTTTTSNTSAVLIQTSSISKPPPPPGRDPYVARFAFASEVFGVLVSASSPAGSGADDKVLYQLAISEQSNTPQGGSR